MQEERLTNRSSGLGSMRGPRLAAAEASWLAAQLNR
jgi:hypothetical protein